MGFVAMFSSFVIRHSCFVIRASSFASSVAFAHNEVQTAEDGHDVAERTAGQKFGQDAEVHKRGRADFQPVRHTAALAVDIKSKLALRIFGSEINFARRSVES